MALEFLRDSAVQAFRKYEADLNLMNPELDLRGYKRMSSDQLHRVVEGLVAEERARYENDPYGSWYQDPKYVQGKVLQDALACLAEHKHEQEMNEPPLVPGYTYYRNVKQFGEQIQGEICHYMVEGKTTGWINFVDAVPVMKALEVLRHGDEEDFRKIYIEMADGRVDGVVKVCVEHITESSDDALRRMEAYCDTQWSGPWPWQTPTPWKLKKLIEGKKEMHLRELHQMQEQFRTLLKEFQNQDATKWEVLDFTQDLSDKIQSMIENLARTSGEIMVKLRVQLPNAMGPQAQSLEQQVIEPINRAVDALSQLLSAVQQIMDQLQGQQGPGMDDIGGLNGMGDELGMGGAADPMGGGMEDDLGGEGGDPGLNDHLASVAPEDFQPERPVKEM